MSIRVLLADDHAAIRAGLRMILETDDGIEVVGEAADGAVAIAQARALRPDVVLMDIRMPGVDGIAATAAITGELAGKVLVLTSFEIDEYVFGSLRAGASGYLLKTVSADELIRSVRAVHDGAGVLAPEVTRAVIAGFAVTASPAAPARQELQELTGREREVFDCLGEGLSNRQIARRLGIGETTAKTHVARVLRKLGLQSRIQAAIMAQGR